MKGRRLRMTVNTKRTVWIMAISGYATIFYLVYKGVESLFK